MTILNIRDAGSRLFWRVARGERVLTSLVGLDGLLAAAAVTLGAVGVGVLYSMRARIRGTTLAGPWWWFLASVVLVAAVEVMAVYAEDWPLIPLLRLGVACATFCPVMSLLGAKRPQDRGWHFVVLSLWIVLILPILESSLRGPGRVPDLRGLRSGFIIILMLLGLLNSLPTRFWISAILLMFAQCQLLASVLPPPVRFLGETPVGGLGLVLLVASVISTALIASTCRRGAKPLDRLWLDFRDAYGLLWGLRVAEQINAVATAREMDLMLRWSGFSRADGSELPDVLPEETDRVLRQSFDNLLRRFVSPEWIARRLASRVN